MIKIKKSNLTKLDISKKINSKIGLSIPYANELTEDIIITIKDLIMSGDVNIKNFGTFKIKNKKERIGRNPKTNMEHKIVSQRSLSFNSSKKLNNKINNF
ncbi:MAG: HU family DNA-binding protein [Candidatus Pelagibacter sp.]|tara:strand:- start:634 stop:933 length:300 start_codon:yes stop_codon:yes gene_type:complete